MALYEFSCKACKTHFEQYTNLQEEGELGKCPKCGSKDSERVLSSFRVGGKGDLRESTWDGCHGPVGGGGVPPCGSGGCGGGGCGESE